MSFLKSAKWVSFIIALCATLLSPLSFAKTLNMYDQPKDDAKIVGSLDSSNGMVPIFTPDKSEWMKVGDPKNGNVGWIKTSDLGNKDGSVATQFSMSQKTVDTKTGPKTVQVVEFSTPKPMTAAQTDAMQKDIKAREDKLEKSVQKMMSDVYRQMSAYYMQNPTLTNTPNMPVILPIIVYPQDQSTAKSADPSAKPLLPPPSTK